MTKTVRVSGLNSALAWLHPLIKGLAVGRVQLADGVTLNLPDETTLSFSEGGDPESIRVEFSGVTATIDKRALLGLLHVHATEPVTYADVGPASIETQVGIFKIVAVDGGGS